MFIAVLCTIAKTWNQPKCPSMIDWKKKMWHIYTMEYYAALKNDEFIEQPRIGARVEFANGESVLHFQTDLCCPQNGETPKYKKTRDARQ